MVRNDPVQAGLASGLDDWDRLDRFLAADKPRTALSSVPVAPAPGAGAPRILVAEDNPSHQILTCRMLSRLGVTTLLAADGAEAVALACASEFDLILMDLHMPVLDGFGATRRIRRFEQQHARARTPVVAYTSCPYPSDDPFVLQFGIDAVLAKPSTAKAFQDCLLAWLPAGRTGSIASAPDRGAPSLS